MRLASFVFFSLLVLSGWCQDSLANAASDSTAFAQASTAVGIADSSKVPKRPFNLALHIDYGKILTLPFDFENKYEGGVALEIFENIAVVGEFGFWDKDADQAIENGSYNSTGTYWRLGAGFNLPFNTPGSQIGFGFRYAESTFDDEGSFQIESADDLTDPFTGSFTRQDLSASWLSGVLTSTGPLKLKKKVAESPLNRLFKIGVQLRWRFLRSYDRTLSDTDPIEVYTIPGYGRTLSDNTLAINFFVRFYPLGY